MKSSGKITPEKIVAANAKARKSPSKSAEAKRKQTSTQSLDDQEVEVPVKKKVMKPAAEEKPVKRTKKTDDDEYKDPAAMKKSVKAKKEEVTPKTDEKPKKHDVYDIVEKVHPAKARSAYMCFGQEKFAEGTEEDKMTFQKVGALWKELNETQKKKYEALAIKDKSRFENQNKMFMEKGYFVDEDGIKSNDFTKRTPKFKKDVILPKPQRSPYIAFQKAEFTNVWEDIKKKNPNAKVHETMTLMAVKWNELSDKQKKPYEKLSEDDIQRYDAQIHELLTKGYFVNEDGKKSTDMKKKVKRVKKDENAEMKDSAESSEDDAKKTRKPAVKRAKPSESEESHDEKVQPKKKRQRKD